MVYLIFTAGLKLFKQLEKTPLNIILMGTVIAAMILATSLTIGLKTVFSFGAIGDAFSSDVSGIIILLVLFTIHFAYKHITKKKPSPIFMILLSAGLGMLLYS